MSDKLGNGAERVAALPGANKRGWGVGDHLRAFVLDADEVGGVGLAYTTSNQHGVFGL